jgi:hypothetical protein
MSLRPFALCLATLVCGVAHADDPSCETITTVRCTGTAAPLALPGAQGPAAVAAPLPPPTLPPTVIPVPPPTVPAPPVVQENDYELPRLPAPSGPPCCAEPAVEYPSQTAVLPGGWKLVSDGGRLMLERKKKKGVAGVWAPGLALWMISYLGTSASGAMTGRAWAAAPFLGGFIAGGIDMAENKLGSGIGWSIGSAMQLSGFVMFLVGVSVGEKIERMPVGISPVSYRDGGGGVNLVGRF